MINDTSPLYSIIGAMYQIVVVAIVAILILIIRQRHHSTLVHADDGVQLSLISTRILW